VFGNAVGVRNAASGKAKLTTLLALQLEDVDKTCGLAEAQKKKLLLAGRGDIKRFMDQVEEKRQRFMLIKNDQNKIGEFYQEIVPLQTALQSGIYHTGSVFSKTLKKALGSEQATRYDKVVAEKQQFRYRAKVELVVAQLDQSVRFTDQQRRGLRDLILQETRAPRRFGQYDYYIVLYQASKIAPERMKTIFDEAQWKLLNSQLAQGRGMELFLKNSGYLAEDDRDPAPAHVIPAIPLRPAAPKGGKRADDLPDEVFESSAVLPGVSTPLGTLVMPAALFD
jgi:hypothetical protein